MDQNSTAACNSFVQRAMLPNSKKKSGGPMRRRRALQDLNPNIASLNVTLAAIPANYMGKNEQPSVDKFKLLHITKSNSNGKNETSNRSLSERRNDNAYNDSNGSGLGSGLGSGSGSGRRRHRSEVSITHKQDCILKNKNNVISNGNGHGIVCNCAKLQVDQRPYKRQRKTKIETKIENKQESKMKKLNLNFIDNENNNENNNNNNNNDNKKKKKNSSGKSMSSRDIVRNDRIFDLQQKQKNKNMMTVAEAIGNQSLNFGIHNMHVLSYNKNLEIFNDEINQQQYQQQPHYQQQQQQQQYEYDYNDNNKILLKNHDEKQTNKTKNKNKNKTRKDENKHNKHNKKNKEKSRKNNNKHSIKIKIKNNNNEKNDSDDKFKIKSRFTHETLNTSNTKPKRNPLQVLNSNDMNKATPHVAVAPTASIAPIASIQSIEPNLNKNNVGGDKNSKVENRHEETNNMKREKISLIINISLNEQSVIINFFDFRDIISLIKTCHYFHKNTLNLVKKIKPIIYNNETDYDDVELGLISLFGKFGVNTRATPTTLTTKQKEDIIKQKDKNINKNKHKDKNKDKDKDKKNRDSDSDNDVIIYQSSLKYLDLSNVGCCVTDEVLKIISKYGGGTNLRYLNLQFCYQITDNGIQYIIDKCKYIQYFNVSGCQQLTNKFVQNICIKNDSMKHRLHTLNLAWNSNIDVNIIPYLLYLNEYFKLKNVILYECNTFQSFWHSLQYSLLTINGKQSQFNNQINRQLARYKQTKLKEKEREQEIAKEKEKQEQEQAKNTENNKEDEIRINSSSPPKIAKIAKINTTLVSNINNSDCDGIKGVVVNKLNTNTNTNANRHKNKNTSKQNIDCDPTKQEWSVSPNAILLGANDPLFWDICENNNNNTNNNDNCNCDSDKENHLYHHTMQSTTNKTNNLSKNKNKVHIAWECQLIDDSKCSINIDSNESSSDGSLTDDDVLSLRNQSSHHQTQNQRQDQHQGCQEYQAPFSQLQQIYYNSIISLTRMEILARARERNSSNNNRYPYQNQYQYPHSSTRYFSPSPSIAGIETNINGSGDQQLAAAAQTQARSQAAVQLWTNNMTNRRSLSVSSSASNGGSEKERDVNNGDTYDDDDYNGYLRKNRLNLIGGLRDHRTDTCELKQQIEFLREYNIFYYSKQIIHQLKENYQNYIKLEKQEKQEKQQHQLQRQQTQLTTINSGGLGELDSNTSINTSINNSNSANVSCVSSATRALTDDDRLKVSTGNLNMDDIAIMCDDDDDHDCAAANSTNLERVTFLSEKNKNKNKNSKGSLFAARNNDFGVNVRNIKFLLKLERFSYYLDNISEYKWKHKINLISQSQYLYDCKIYGITNSRKIYLIFTTEYGLFGIKLSPQRDFFRSRKNEIKYLQNVMNPLKFLIDELCLDKEWINNWHEGFQSVKTLTMIGVDNVNYKWIKQSIQRITNDTYTSSNSYSNSNSNIKNKKLKKLRQKANKMNILRRVSVAKHLLGKIDKNLNTSNNYNNNTKFGENVNSNNIV